MKKTIASFLVASIAAFSLAGCSLPRPNNPDLWHNTPKSFVVQSEKQEINILAISGGAVNGCWSAAFLNGWQNKPRFDVVTGVSAGSLASTFAFLDKPEYETVLREAYTTIKPDNVIDPRPLSSIVFNNSLNSNAKLKATINKYITDKIIDEVAAEGDSGRKLLVGTTDLDFGIFRTWDMIAIAKEKKYDQYREVLLASSSIPIVFPPVFLPTGSMNVDGGVLRQVFIPKITPDSVHKNIYVLYNGVPGAFGETQVNNSLKDIASRTIAIMADRNSTAALGDIFYEKNATIFYSQIDKDVKLLGLEFQNADLVAMYQAGLKAGTNQSWSSIIKN